MIDLTKPIRRKATGNFCIVPHSTRVSDLGNGMYAIAEQWEPGQDPQVFVTSDEYLRGAFENVPESTKPRDWIVFRRADGTISTVVASVENAVAIRVVEWPCGVPLPEWPT